MAARPPKGEVIRNPTKHGFKFALRFTAGGKRHYVTLGTLGEGWSQARADEELQNVLADARRGILPQKRAPIEIIEDPTFHEFSTAWLGAVKGELRPGTVQDYENQLRVHLLPFFKDHRLAQITVAEVDRYREAKVREKGLGATSINKTITRLGQILEVAVERELIVRNAAKVGGKRRKVKPVTPRRAYLDRAEQITALLDAAGQLDAEARATAKINRRAILSTLTFAGLRISELVALDWADVDLAAGRLRVRESKTDAGIRYVDLLPVLAAELRSLKVTAVTDVTLPAGRRGVRLPKSGDPVFPSAVGTRSDRNRIAKRVLGHPAKGKDGPDAGAVGRANEQLAAAGLSALPDGLTLHALRRTFASLLFSIGRPAPYVMAQMGHTDGTMTLALYAKVMNTSEADQAALARLVSGDYLAVAGSGTDLTVTGTPDNAEGISAEVA